MKYNVITKKIRVTMSTTHHRISSSVHRCNDNSNTVKDPQEDEEMHLPTSRRWPWRHACKVSFTRHHFSKQKLPKCSDLHKAISTIFMGRNLRNPHSLADIFGNLGHQKDSLFTFIPIPKFLDPARNNRIYCSLAKTFHIIYVHITR